MKKFFTLLWLALAAFTFKATAQTTCNANFTAQFLNNNTVKFNPASTDSLPTAYHTWAFGDGSPISHNVSPTHTFAVGGYAVVHTIVRPGSAGTVQCTETFTMQIVIQECNLTVNFSWTTAAGNPLTFAFQNLSTPLSPADSITWIFGDNTTSHDVNPVHTYANAGTYNVCLIVKKMTGATTSPCIKYTCKSLTAVLTPCNLIVNFNWTIAQTNPLTFEFHNTSTPLSSTDTITWTFGDGTTSHDVNPAHTYANYGTYTVCLTVKKVTTVGAAPCVRDICKTIVIQLPCILVVDFSWNVLASNPRTVSFQNLSVPLSTTDSITWTFGDGTSSHDVNPTHTYTNGGSYQVCLTVKKNNNSGTAPCIRYICKTIVIQQPCNLVVDFSWNVSTANPLIVLFHNLSTPLATTDSITWTFGDGSSSHDVNPTHTYANSGTYHVCLVVKKNTAPGTEACIRYICKYVTVQVPCTLVANFTWQASTTNPQSIYFTNTSAGAASTDSVRWTFGDGTSASTFNANHVYAQQGIYTVCLRMQKRNNNGTISNCVSEKCQTIEVHAACNFQVTWTSRLDSVNVKKVYFNNTTAIPAGTGAALWSFGDGTTSTSWNAVHEYANPGRYYVCLRVEMGPNCVRYRCDSVTVPVPAPPCNNQSNFTVVGTAANSQTFTFTPAYQSSTVTYSWSFGDGTGSNAMVATHHYATAGTYTACLTVWRSSTCVSTTCKTVVVTSQINCDSIHVAYTYQFDPYLPNKVYFYANANFPILDQTWTITKMPPTTPPNQVVLHTNNPSYVFNDTGYYRVCLRAVTLGGCIKEYCNYVHIEHVPVQCQLAAYPNPASNEVHINVPLTSPDMINVYVYNNLNVLVLEKHQQGVVGNNIVALNISNLISGYYTVRVIYGNHICNSAFQKL